MKGKVKRISKRLSYVLRHAPETVGIELEDEGWVSVETLLRNLGKNGLDLSLELLKEVVETNDKQRFEFDESGERIRARQGHSVEVDLGYKPMTPPEFLWHGTAERNLESIREKGLIKANRHHVHLSENKALMLEVGRRHGKATLVKIQSEQMAAAGHEFFLTENGVWLTDSVPPEFLVWDES